MPFSRRKPKRDVELPTDSVSDIAFLLIIFFILTTTLAKVSGFKVELPSADTSQSQKKQEEKTPSVQLTDGKILFNEQGVSIDELRDRLLDLQLDKKQGEQKVVTLEAAGKVDYQAYYEAMAAIATAGGVVALLEEGE
jgi:biopolymer transport protein ExbD